ncbi:MAG TPA: hypothetical protein VKB23_07955 [Solirubrobacterales bacterium]|nr:hypothetical protein [Solirubrobacterales bacterium]
MVATAVIAIYAACVASATLLVQYAQWRSSRTLMRIQIHAGVAPVVSETEDPYGNKLHKDDEVLFVQLTNRSPHAVKITHVGAISVGDKEKKGIAFARPHPLHLSLPFEIPALDNLTPWQPRQGLHAWEGRRIQVGIRTAAGDDFESHVFRLDELTRLKIVGNYPPGH